MCALGTHAIAHLVMHACQIVENHLFVVLNLYSSVAHFRPSRTTQSHVTHSDTCSIVWFRQDNPTRRPVGVPGMVDQP